MAGSPADSGPEQTCALHGYISNKNLDPFILYIYIDACVFQKKKRCLVYVLLMFVLYKYGTVFTLRRMLGELF